MRQKRTLLILVGVLIAIGGFVSGCRSGQSDSETRTEPGAPTAVDVTVDEGTSMSVAVSPDGRTLAVDLQGSIWTLPVSGGAATRITDVFNDARQPTWSPDGRTIAFFSFRDGGYDIWAVEPDGTNQRKLTWGPFDDREPAWSHDGTRLAFSSDRSSQLGGDYNIWVMDVVTGELRQVTNDSANDFMPSWSPDDTEIAFISQRGATPANRARGRRGRGQQSVWIANVSEGSERRLASTMSRADAPSWGPGGQIVYHTLTDGESRLEVDGTPLTSSENAFPFRVSWGSSGEFYYTSDGKIRKRALESSEAETIEFTATLRVTPPSYAKRPRDFDDTSPRKALGLVRPTVSPDGTKVAFAALNDIYVMPIGAEPENITNDSAYDTDPAWSPDGSQLVYSSDKGGNQLQLWVHDMATDHSRQLTTMSTQPLGAAWSPDGTRIAVFNVTGMWRVAEFSVVDVATGTVTKVHDQLPQPGPPTWSPDGTRLAIAGSLPYSSRFREGTNQVLTMSATADGDDRWYVPVRHLSIDSRGGCGPVWSPDGTKMAAIYEGTLSVWPVAASGEPLGPPRQVTTEHANSPSWQGDSKHLVYLSDDKLKRVNIETGEARELAVNLTYTVDVPETRLVVHASRLVDGTNETAKNDVDIVIEGNRIGSIEPHVENLHAGTVVDASGLTVMPGLIEWHSHLQPDFGEAAGRAHLAFGVTTVRSPGGIPYEAVEEREASDANLRVAPRYFTTGHLMEYERVYYKMGIAIASPRHLELELRRAQVLQYDLLKSYVRMTDVLQKRIVEFAHDIGVPASTHEIYPAALVGMDGSEHTSGTSRRGYSPKIGTLQQSYADVSQIFGATGTIWCPMVSRTGLARLWELEPEMRMDPRFSLYPGWMQRQVSGQGGRLGAASQAASGEIPGTLQMVMNIQKAGGKVVAGTDSPNAFNLHGELMAYVMAGMTPYQALRAATVVPAEALGLDAGSIEVGRLADLVIVEGNPLEDITATHRVRHVVSNGRAYSVEDLVAGTAGGPMP